MGDVGAMGRSVRFLLAVVAATTVVLGAGVQPASAGNADNVNHPAYWQAQGWGSCVKYDPVATPYGLGSAPSGYYWSLLVLKAGSASSNEDWLTQIPNPAPGPYYHPSGKTISHVIVCKKAGTAPTTTTTTTPGQDCHEYTPTFLALSKSSAEPGETVTVTGSGVPGDTLVIKISKPGQPTYALGSVVVGPGGTFSIAVIIPDDYPPGSYTITVRSNGCTCPGTSTTTGPPNTGDNDNDNDNDNDWNHRSFRTGGGDNDNDNDGDNDSDDGGGNNDNDDQGDNDNDSDNDDSQNSPCYGAGTANITVTSLDLAGCGSNLDDRVFAQGEVVPWDIMGTPFDTTKPPVTLKLQSRTPGGPTYTLYSGSYPASMTKNVTIPAAAPFDRYYLVQTGKDKKSKTVTKSCPVRVGLEAVLASSSSASSQIPRAVTSAAFVGLGAWMLVLLRRRRPARV